MDTTLTRASDAPATPNIPAHVFVDAFYRTGLAPIQGDYFSKSACGACALAALVFDTWARGRTGLELGTELQAHPRGIGLLVEDAIHEWYNWSRTQIEAFIDGFDGDRSRHKTPPPQYREWFLFGKSVYRVVAARFAVEAKTAAATLAG